MDKTKIKLIISFVELTAIAAYIALFYITPLINLNFNYQNDINSLNKEINEIKKELTQKNSFLEKFESGKCHEFYNPTYNETLSHRENETYISVNTSINNLKNKGINCALVQVIMGKTLDMIELICFNTTDKGMVYFELKTNYQVIPIIGYKYINCVVGYPYKFSLFNDTIVDVLIIW
jgi:hypothetical protein